MHLAFASLGNLELQNSKYGKTVKDLNKFRGQVVSSIFQLQADILYKELGIEIEKDGTTIKSVNMKAFSNMLEREAEERNWSIKDKSEIRLRKERYLKNRNIMITQNINEYEDNYLLSELITY